MRLNLQRASAQEDCAGPPSLALTKQFLQDNPLVQFVTNTREMIPLHSNGRTCGTEDRMPTLRLQMNPQYDYGCKQNADGNSLFVTRHAPCDRDTTSESELPPALRDEELSRTHLSRLARSRQQRAMQLQSIIERTMPTGRLPSGAL